MLLNVLNYFKTPFFHLSRLLLKTPRVLVQKTTTKVLPALTPVASFLSAVLHSTFNYSLTLSMILELVSRVSERHFSVVALDKDLGP